ncbi:hypothetical protein ONZ45_g2667 [Pleurotus djamor]|nr:hypothetical protein ONZ45_g2667 [Pleurotus djamor]
MLQRSEELAIPSAVTRLPAEILLRILREATTSDDDDFSDERVLVPVALHVCRRWRQVAFKIPSLWRPIDISFVTPDELALTLTGPLPSLLRVTCSKWTKANVQSWATSVMGAIEHIWEFKLLNITSTPIIDTLSLHIDRPASDLRALHAFIKVPTQKRTKGKKAKVTLPPLEHMRRFMDRSMPRLRMLELDNFPVFPWSPEKPPSFSNIEVISLTMWCNSDHANFSQIVPLLEASSKSLTYLSLSNVIPDMGDEPGAGLIRLPFLEALSITTNKSNAISIARLLQIPQVTVVILSSQDVDLSLINTEDIIQFYERIYPHSPLLCREKTRNGDALVISVSKESLAVNATSIPGPLASFTLHGSSSQTDHSAALLNLAIRFCNIFNDPRRVEYRFPSASMDCDWSAFLRNLEYANDLAIRGSSLTTLRKFMLKCDLRHLASRLKELKISIDIHDDIQTSRFEDEDAENDALRDVIISLCGHLRAHIESYDSITTVVFNAEPFSAFDFHADFVESELDFDWVVEGDSLVEGTRGEASILKFSAGDALVLEPDE